MSKQLGVSTGLTKSASVLYNSADQGHPSLHRNSQVRSKTVASTPDRYVWKVSPESIYTLYKALVETV
jgi:hypothetical protein